jgi:Zn-dependent protease with chaperone function
MTLYIEAAGLLFLAAALLGPSSLVLARARWVDQAPRAAVALWQAMGVTSLLAGIGGGLCVAVERYQRGFVGGVSQLGRGLVGGRPLTGLGLPDALGLTLAADLFVVLGFLLASVTLRIVTARARHRRLVDLLAVRTHRTGAAVLDHSGAVAYCIPGFRPRIVISAGAVALLDDAQLDAVVAHEQGHATERHGLVMLPLVGVSRVFAFVPYARLASQAVAGLLEMAADDYAVLRRGRGALLSALVSMATAGAPTHCSLALTGGSVARRVERLIADRRGSSRVACAAVGTAVALLALPVALLLLT